MDPSYGAFAALPRAAPQADATSGAPPEGVQAPLAGDHESMSPMNLSLSFNELSLSMSTAEQLADILSDPRQQPADAS